MKYIGASAARVGALAKYLLALSAPSVHADGSNPHDSNLRPRQLPVPYLINDWLHHIKYHLQDQGILSIVIASLYPFLGPLLFQGALFRGKGTQYEARVEELVELWERHAYFSKEELNEVRQRATATHKAKISGSHPEPPDNRLEGKFQPKQTGLAYQLPAFHGDHSVPYYDLPAATLMPHIIPNVVMPLNPSHVKPIECAPGPPDERLAKALEHFMTEVDTIYGMQFVDESTKIDYDEFGQISYGPGHDEEEEGYYGWSRPFCEKMHRKRRNADLDEYNGGARSISPPVRRVKSPISNHSMSRSQSPLSHGIGLGREAVDSSKSHHGRLDGRQCDSPSDLPRLNHGRNTLSNYQRSRSPSYSPPLEPPISQLLYFRPGPPQAAIPPVATPLPYFNNHLPIPPRPPNYNGPWPPPPPPPPPIDGRFPIPFAQVGQTMIETLPLLPFGTAPPPNLRGSLNPSRSPYME